MKCAVYCRVSTEMDSQKDSLQNQQTFFENYIRSNGWELVKIYTDEGISGTSTVKRKALLNLMNDAKNKKFDVVLVKSLSRWARDTVDSITLTRTLKSLNINLICIEDNYNAFQDENEMKLTMCSMMAQSESDTISKRSKFGIREKSRKGSLHGGAPYGYDKLNGKLIPNTYTSTIVMQIYDLYLRKGWGMQKIANYLTDNNIPTSRSFSGSRNAGNIWHYSTINQILTNPHYTGSLMQGRSMTDVNDKIFSSKHGYKKRRQVSEEEWIISENTHPAIITKEEFNEVQERIKLKSQKIYKGRGNKALFARLAFCPDCGAGMNYKNDRQGYVCATYQKNGNNKCHSHFIKGEELKQQVLNDIRELANNNVSMSSLLKDVKNKASNNQQKFAKDIKQVIKEIESLKNQKLKLVELLSDDIIDKNDYSEQYQSLSHKHDMLIKRKLELDTLIESDKSDKEEFDSFQKDIKNFVNLNIDDVEKLRSLLQKLIDKVIVYEDGNISITYNFKNPMLKGA